MSVPVCLRPVSSWSVSRHREESGVCSGSDPSVHRSARRCSDTGCRSDNGGGPGVQPQDRLDDRGSDGYKNKISQSIIRKFLY